MIRKYAEIFCWKNVSSFCSAKATHIFSAKNIRILYIESTKTVNEMTLNELVKLTMLWTTGPWMILSLCTGWSESMHSALVWRLFFGLTLSVYFWYSLESYQCFQVGKWASSVAAPEQLRNYFKNFTILLYNNQILWDLWTTKTLIRHYRCTDWSCFLVFPFEIVTHFSWRFLFI